MVKLNKIYTRTGDDGSTGLVDGSRRSKADARMHAIGEVDEANSALGIAIGAWSETVATPNWSPDCDESRTICSIWGPTLRRQARISRPAR
jgi:hypothetical protein